MQDVKDYVAEKRHKKHGNAAKIDPKIFPRYICGRPNARNRPTINNTAPIPKSKKFAHGKSRVIGNRAKNSYENNPATVTTKPTQIGQFHFRFMSSFLMTFEGSNDKAQTRSRRMLPRR